MSGENDTPSPVGTPQLERQQPVESARNWAKELLFHFHQQILRINKTMNDPALASKHAITLINGLTAEVQTRFGGFAMIEALRHPLWRDLFDDSRKGFREVISRLLADRELKRAIGEEETARWGRNFYARFIRSLLDQSQTGSEEQSKSFKGVAWSILARDIDGVMVPQGHLPISSEWRARMGRLINSKSLDMKGIHQELDRFVSGDPAVFRTPSATASMTVS